MNWFFNRRFLLRQKVFNAYHGINDAYRTIIIFNFVSSFWMNELMKGARWWKRVLHVLMNQVCFSLSLYLMLTLGEIEESVTGNLEHYYVYLENLIIFLLYLKHKPWKQVNTFRSLCWKQFYVNFLLGSTTCFDFDTFWCCLDVFLNSCCRNLQ